MSSKLFKKVDAAGRAAVKLLFRPIKSSNTNSTMTKNKTINAKILTWQEWVQDISWGKFESWLFPHMPEHYPLSKKLALVKAQSRFGKIWDVLLILMSVLACIIYVCETYMATYNAVQVYSIIELVVTQFFALDFLYNMASSSNIWHYMTEGWTIVDIVTIVPVYITLGLAANGESGGTGVNLSVFRIIRILRLIRVLRMFKLLNGLSGVQRQLVTLSLTLTSLIFMAAGIIHIMENDLKQIMEYNCSYINANTLWEPSCKPDLPYSLDTDPCDCVSTVVPQYQCVSGYDSADKNGEPSAISCSTVTFLDAFYFLVVTVSTVGYGDILPTTQASRAVVVIFIITSVVLIPVQVNELTVLLAANSTYRQPYKSTNGESHVIICGYVSDWRKLEKFFKEFFHPDRTYSAAPDFHAVIMNPVEPSDDLKALLYSSHFDGRITYLIGSSLSTEDLQKARADVASAMFFFCNAETHESNAKLDDAATVLRTLSVSNFNPDLECFVQVLKPEDRDILKDSEVDVIYCLDEYKTCIQARNVMCPGISTLIENMFHTFSAPSVLNVMSEDGGSSVAFNQWMEDYCHGLSMEPYYVPLMPRYCEMLSYEWTLMVEGIFLEFDCMVLGVASSIDHSLLLNPGKKEMKKFEYNSRFFKKYNMLILLCSEQSMASSIATGLDDPVVIDRILNKLLVAEENFTVRKGNKHVAKGKNSSEKKKVGISSLREIIRVTKTWSGYAAATVTAEDDEEVEGDEADDYIGYISKKTKIKGEKANKLAKMNQLSYIASRGIGIRQRTSSNISFDEFDNEDDYSDEEEWSDEELGLDEGNVMSQGKGGRLNRGRLNSFDSPLRAQELALMRTGTSGSDGQLLETVGGELDANGMLVQKVAMNSIENAAHLNGHIVVFGCTTNLFMFLAELRRPIHACAVDKTEPPAVVVVDETAPNGWTSICEDFSNVWFIKGKMTRSTDFNRTNIRACHSVALLAGRDNVTRVEEENLDADALFSYLKLEKYIPKDVFFTVELTCASNMAVLNSTVVRRSRGSQIPKKDPRMKKAKAGAYREKHQAVGGGKDVTKSTEMSTGNFSSHKAVMKTENYESLSRGILNIIASVPARRISSIEPKDANSNSRGPKQTASQRLESFWTTQDSHQMLSVFASGNAFVPATFDSVLAQSFYTAFTPLLCERLVCGSKHQTIVQIDVPTPFIGRYFVDLYRAFMSRNLMVLSIYRAPVATDGAILPFVFTSPHADTMMRFKDRLFVICNPETMKENIKIFNEELVDNMDGTLSLSDTLGVQLGDLRGAKDKDSKLGDEEETKADGLESPNVVNRNSPGQIKTKFEESPVKRQVSKVFFEGTSLNGEL